jgi:hypothetical protein
MEIVTSVFSKSVSTFLALPFEELQGLIRKELVFLNARADSSRLNCHFLKHHRIKQSADVFHHKLISEIERRFISLIFSLLFRSRTTATFFCRTAFTDFTAKFAIFRLFCKPGTRIFIHSEFELHTFVTFSVSRRFS